MIKNKIYFVIVFISAFVCCVDKEIIKSEQSTIDSIPISNELGELYNDIQYAINHYKIIDSISSYNISPDTLKEFLQNSNTSKFLLINDLDTIRHIISNTDKTNFFLLKKKNKFFIYTLSKSKRTKGFFVFKEGLKHGYYFSYDNPFYSVEIDNRIFLPQHVFLVDLDFKVVEYIRLKGTTPDFKAIINYSSENEINEVLYTYNTKIKFNRNSFDYAILDSMFYTKKISKCLSRSLNDFNKNEEKYVWMKSGFHGFTKNDIGEVDFYNKLNKCKLSYDSSNSVR